MHEQALGLAGALLWLVSSVLPVALYLVAAADATRSRRRTSLVIEAVWMGRPRRLSEPHSGGEGTIRVVDPARPEVRVGRACAPVDHENLERFGWSERTDEGRRRVVRSAARVAVFPCSRSASGHVCW